MIDFFSSPSNSQNPTILIVIYSILMSVVLSTFLAVTYEHTTRDTVKKRHFIQAIVLIAIVASMVMQAIGDSVARGLGMLGALSIIRFRNTIVNPRNIVFIFASLAIGIACGVYGFYVATMGTTIFILTTLVLYYSPYSQSNNLVGTMVINASSDRMDQLEKVIKSYCKRLTKTRFKITKGTEEIADRYLHHYQFRLKDNVLPEQLYNEIEKDENAIINRFDISDTPEQI